MFPGDQLELVKRMFHQNHYVPILRWKRAERRALEFLHEQVKAGMSPLI